MKSIHLYDGGIEDLETSSFEILETFHIRSELYHLPLSKEVKKMVAAHDMNLLSHIEPIFEHVNKIYDFSDSKENID